MSAATVIFMAGDERFSSEYTDFLIHNVTINGTDMTTKDLESLINESTRLNSELAKIYSIVGGKKTIAEISQVMNEDKKIIATEAAELGLVTEIF
jgi:ATP-dependent protease ClpP protease subunit